MGPTASGKTEVAIGLCKRFPFEIISVDSALVYRGMDIGTAKPDAATLERTPHRLIDIRDPEDPYSAGEFVRDATLAMEAIFGAVYLDAGFDAAAKVIHNAFGDRLRNMPSVEDLRDPKTRLQEWLQARSLGLPEYELIKASGKAHKQVFEVACTIKDRAVTTTGFGTTRRNAEQESAEKMLTVLDDGATS